MPDGASGEGRAAVEHGPRGFRPGPRSLRRTTVACCVRLDVNLSPSTHYNPFPPHPFFWRSWRRLQRRQFQRGLAQWVIASTTIIMLTLLQTRRPMTSIRLRIIGIIITPTIIIRTSITAAQAAPPRRIIVTSITPSPTPPPLLSQTCLSPVSPTSSTHAQAGTRTSACPTRQSMLPARERAAR